MNILRKFLTSLETVVTNQRNKEIYSEDLGCTTTIGAEELVVTKENSQTLHTIHKFCTKSKDIKYDMFIKNISAITVLSSYDILPSSAQTG